MLCVRTSANQWFCSRLEISEVEKDATVVEGECEAGCLC